MNEEQKRIFQKNLKTLREKSGKKQKDIADAVFISRAALSSYEIGTRTPSLETIFRLAEYFNVSVSYLLGLNEKNDDLDEITKIRVSHLKYLTKGRYLDIKNLSPVAMMELLDFYDYLLKREMRTNTEQKKKTS